MKSVLNKLQWSARRLRVPVGRSALVLEVGSGGNPYPRANVLLDAYEETSERFWAPLVHDRPTIMAFGESMPFKDHAFDFVIAAHVLEHSRNPAAFLRELQRVARAGYIETPDAFMERINPYRDHRLEVTVRDGTLMIRKKSGWKVDPELVELYESRAKKRIAGGTIPEHPSDFHMCFYWEGDIPFRIHNPETDSDWLSDSGVGQHPRGMGIKERAREALIAAIRGIASQRARNRNLDVLPLLRCVRCNGNVARKSDSAIRCGTCGTSFKVNGQVYDMRITVEGFKQG